MELIIALALWEIFASAIERYLTGIDASGAPRRSVNLGLAPPRGLGRRDTVSRPFLLVRLPKLFAEPVAWSGHAISQRIRRHVGAFG